MAFYDFLACRQPDAAARIFVLVQPLKYFEYLFSLSGGDADSFVVDSEEPFLLLPLGRDMDTGGHIAMGSHAETEYLFSFSNRLGYFKSNISEIEGLIAEVGRLLWSFRQSI